MRRIIALALIIVSISCFAQKSTDKPYLVVLSMDGFRWDYADSYPTPNLHAIARQGVKAKALIPPFPSNTFPSHYTMATGLYPDHHGIVNNAFRDPEIGEYKMSNSKNATDGRFYGGEPIWVTAGKQKVITANYFWPGSEAEIKGIRPAYWKKYNNADTYEQRIDTVIHWLSLDESKRPHLIMFYFDNPDYLTHSVGPMGNGVKEMVMRLDTLVGIIMEKLNKLSIGKQVNFLVVSDHGMEATNEQKSVILDHYINKKWCDYISGYNSLISIDPKPGYSDSIYNCLSKAPHVKMWDKKDMPERFHYGTNPRIGEIVVLADSAYSMRWKDDRPINSGNHGYDNLNSDMYGIFYGIGPAFKSGYEQKSFCNVNLYALMAQLLKLKPAVNDGDFETVKDMLKP